MKLEITEDERDLAHRTILYVAMRMRNAVEQYSPPPISGSDTRAVFGCEFANDRLLQLAKKLEPGL